MNKNNFITLLTFFILPLFYANAQKTDTHIIGHVTSNGEHLPFATILIEGTIIGTATDETGHFRILNLEPDTYKVKAQAVGYKSQIIMVELKLTSTKEIKFDLEEDLIGLEQVVVTANRNEQNRYDAMTLVNTITPRLFESTQSVALGEVLNFSSGLRLENNCQNCGFTQVRMNGMEGPYSQILINNRPIFSGLAGVYGLELFPANMIERVEVVRGGGSALYGSNAIAGTINLITKDPIKSGFEVNTNGSLIGVGLEGSGKQAMEEFISFNGSIVDNEAKAGVTVYGFVRDRDAFDANNDDFTELSEIKNTTVGTRAFHRTGKRGKVTIDYFNIRENRRGGNKLNYTFHDADIAEAVDHNINTGAIAYDQLFGNADKFSVFGSVQHVNRATYYGAKEEMNGVPDMSAYGQTYDLSYSTGAQLYFNRDKLLFARGNLVTGIENNGGWLDDTKLGYFDYNTNEPVANRLIADQKTNTFGVFGQAEWELGKYKASVGARFDYYSISDNEHAGEGVYGTVFSPRVSLKYIVTENVQLRASYSGGYRAPQIFDEDLHIEVSGSRRVEHYNDPDLVEERSKSLMASVDITVPLGYMQNQLLLEGFYTLLDDPFVTTPDSLTDEGTTIFIRENGDKAFVAGVNIEWNLAPSSALMISSGFTYQISEYNTPQDDFNEKAFYRTPNTYGFMVIDYDFFESFCLSASGNYTGSMLVPFYGESLVDSEAGELRTSDSFIDLGLKAAYDIKLNGTTLQLSGGIKNILNSYQTDFDSGLMRDPGYMYGPGSPRTIYIGLRFSNF